MATPDLEVIKEIPGYKVILKAVLKAQIQQLVEQLAVHTEEESVILTASVSDGTLCHLGSESGKVFLEDHDDIKSQFLGFCLKRHHRKKQKEKEDAAQVAAQRSVPTTPTRLGPGFGPRPGMSRTGTSPRNQFSPNRGFQGSPRQGFHQGPHPVSLSRASSQGGPVRSSPYPANRPIRRPNFDQGSGGSRLVKPMRLPVASSNDKVQKITLTGNEVIKIEAADDESGSNGEHASTQSLGDPIAGIKIASVSGAEGNASPTVPSSSQSPSSHTPSTPQSADSTAIDNPSEIKSDLSTSDEPTDMKLPEGLSLDSDLSKLISESDTANTSMDSNIPPSTSRSDGAGSAPATPCPGASNIDSNVNVKIEAITESEMDLEITGVEPGIAGDWAPNVQGQMGFPGGSQGDMAGQQPEGYNGVASSSIFPTGVFPRVEMDQRNFAIGQETHAFENKTNTLYKHICPVCGRGFHFKSKLDAHYIIHTGSKPYKCHICTKAFNRASNLRVHILSHSEQYRELTQ